MPSRFFTLGRKFSTTTSAFLTIRLNAATPSGDLKFSVMLRLLRCRFWKSDRSRGPPIASSMPGGASILMTLAPQSASWRTQVGPARTRRQIEHREARQRLRRAGNGHCQLLRVSCRQERRERARTSPIQRSLSTGSPTPVLKSFCSRDPIKCTETQPSFGHFRRAIMNRTDDEHTYRKTGN